MSLVLSQEHNEFYSYENDFLIILPGLLIDKKPKKEWFADSKIYPKFVRFIQPSLKIFNEIIEISNRPENMVYQIPIYYTYERYGKNIIKWKYYLNLPTREWLYRLGYLVPEETNEDVMLSAVELMNT